MNQHLRATRLPTLAAALCGLLVIPAGAQTRVRDPLPIDMALGMHAHNGRSPVNFSPDGQWIAHTVATDDTVPRDKVGTSYSATGFPFAEGDSRMAATLTHTATGETIRLGGPTSSSWAAVWSPDGSRVAFYSDEGGQAGVWVWEMATRKATRIPGVIARPSFGFEVIRWSKDGGKLLCKILPAGMTIADANALGAPQGANRFKKGGPDEPSVHVRRFDPKAAAPETVKPSKGGVKNPPVGNVSRFTSDLAVLDVASGTVTRLVEKAAVRWYAFSPDESMVAYSLIEGWEANSQQPSFEIAVRPRAGGPARTLEKHVRLGYGFEWSWSPDGRHVAYIETGQLAGGHIVLLPAAGGPPKSLKREGVPSFDPGEGEYPPIWSEDSRHLYAVGGAKVWRVDAASGDGTALASVDGWQVRAIVNPFGRQTIWTTDAGKTLWAVARERPGEKSALIAIDLASGTAKPALQESKSYSVTFNLATSTATGAIAFVSTDQQHPLDIWSFDTRTGATRQVSRINRDLERYELGSARLIEWTTAAGKPLKGALLLPPGYTPGTRLPLITIVYGGSMGSNSVNRFGFWEIPTFNAHVLATRGFAVLSPDAPVDEGETMADIVETVMPGVEAAVAQGYADPDRLAVTGQSYGSFNVLSLITQTTRFKAAVITAAVLHPDLFTDYLRAIGYYEQGQGKMGKTIWEDFERYRRNSPLFLFDRITTPLLIGQGEKDGDLVPAEATYAALERLKKPVEYRVYEGEGHVITQRANVRDFWARRLAFFAEQLDLTYDEKGRVEFDGQKARSRSATRPSAGDER